MPLAVLQGGQPQWEVNNVCVGIGLNASTFSFISCSKAANTLIAETIITNKRPLPPEYFKLASE